MRQHQEGTSRSTGRQPEREGGAPYRHAMRPSRCVLLLLPLTGLSGSRVLSLETALESAPRGKAAGDSQEVHTAAAAPDASSQERGGDGRHELDVSARAAGEDKQCS